MSGTFWQTLRPAWRILAASLLGALMLCGFLLSHSYAEGMAASTLCVEGWLGKSLGNQVTLSYWFLFFLLMSGFIAPVFVDGYRAWKGKKPPFSKLAIEGAAAVRWGLEQMALAIVLVVATWGVYGLLYVASDWRELWVPVSALKQCQAPRSIERTHPLPSPLPQAGEGARKQ